MLCAGVLLLPAVEVIILSIGPGKNAYGHETFGIWIVNIEHQILDLRSHISHGGMVTAV